MDQYQNISVAVYNKSVEIIVSLPTPPSNIPTPLKLTLPLTVCDFEVKLACF